MDVNQTELNHKSGLLADLLNQRIQLELLFSTGAVVTLINLPDWIRKQITILGEKNDILFLAILQLSEVFIISVVYALIIGFTLNIFFRVLTLCYLGIDYVFPKGIRIEKLKMSDYASQKLLQNTATQGAIELTERLAGFSFSFSIILVIRLLGLGIVLFLSIFLISISGLDIFSLEYNKSHEGGSIDYLLLFSAFVVLGIFDLIIFVFLRKFNWLSKIYYPISVFFNFISLNFLIRKQVFILNANLGRFAAGALTISFLIIGIFLSNKSNINYGDKRDYNRISPTIKYAFNPKLYDDERNEDTPVQFVSIPSKYISSNQIPVFCAYRAWFDYDLEKFYIPNQNIPKDSVQMLENEEFKRLEAIGKYLVLSVNDTILQKVKWYYCKHPKTEQSGFLTHISIKNLAEGQHQLALNFNVQENNKYVDKKNVNKIMINFVKVEDK
jgi:hypothetical protein